MQEGKRTWRTRSLGEHPILRSITAAVTTIDQREPYENHWYSHTRRFVRRCRGVTRPDVARLRIERQPQQSARRNLFHEVGGPASCGSPDAVLWSLRRLRR